MQSGGKTSLTVSRWTLQKASRADDTQCTLSAIHWLHVLGCRSWWSFCSYVHICSSYTLLSLSPSTGRQSCFAAVTSSQTREPWTTSSCGPMGRSRCRLWTSLCWTSGSACRTCGRLSPALCRSNPATASPEAASYASTCPFNIWSFSERLHTAADVKLLSGDCPVCSF